MRIMIEQENHGESLKMHENTRLPFVHGYGRDLRKEIDHVKVIISNC